MLTSSESDNYIGGEHEQGTGAVKEDIKDELGARAKKPRRKRTMFPAEQVNKLELYFKENSYPDLSQRESLSSELEIEETAINNWFKNKRARIIRAVDKTKKKEPVKKSRLAVKTSTEKTIVDEESVIELKDPLVVENEEEKNVDQDDINKNLQETSYSEDVSVFEFPGYENGRTEVTEAFEPILLKILSSPPK